MVDWSAMHRSSRCSRDAAGFRIARSDAPLLIPVSLRGGKIPTQFLSRATRSVPRRVALDAPAFLQRTGIDGIEPELVQQMGHGGLRSGIVARDDEGAS